MAWRVPRLWPGETVVCIGGGPSLTDGDVAYCRGKAKVIAVNDAYRKAPWADVLYACDACWWRWHGDALEFPGLKVKGASDDAPDSEKSAAWPNVNVVALVKEIGLSTFSDGIAHGRNSGYQAVNLAVLFGANRILLLGYDMKPGNDGRQHWFGQHPSRVDPPYSIFLETYLTLVGPLVEAGVEIVNCTPGSALGCFPMGSLRDALRAAAADGGGN